jgi:hypothetical protein
MTARGDSVQVEARAAGCADLCVSCSSAVKTFANLQIVGDEKHLLPRWMPRGGCTCLGLTPDPHCPLCAPPDDTVLCRPCGDLAATTIERSPS